MPFDNGVGVLTQNGEFSGHVVTVLLNRTWIWYIVVWADGTREHSAEDYWPNYYVANEIAHGFLELVRPSSRTGRFDFAWLSSEDAATTRGRLGILASDF